MNISIAQQYIGQEFGFNDTQIGWIFAAFLVGYSIFQVPAGMLGDRYGPRIVLTISALGWAVTTVLTGLVPGLLIKGVTAVLGSLIVLRFVHGVGEASTYPVAMNAVSIWFEPQRHPFVTALIFTGSTLGSAFAPPFVASMMVRYGWRATFYVSALLPLLLAIVWWRESKYRPKEEISPKASSHTVSFHSWMRLLAKPAILALSSSYLLYCYSISIFVYWLFKYLVDVRHLSVAHSGWANSFPWITASAAVPIFGFLTTSISRRLGALRARRLIAVSCLGVSAMMMTIGAGANRIGLALGAISLCVGFLFSTESSYWSTAIDLARDEAGAASGVMNLAGNLGSVLSTLLVPVFVVKLGWMYALFSGSVFAAVAAVLWFLIREPER